MTGRPDLALTLAMFVRSLRTGFACTTAAVLAGALGACRPRPAAVLPPPTTATPGRASIVIGPEALAPKVVSPGYAGLGPASLPPKILDVYRPRPLPADVSRRIESLIDVRAPGIGALSPDGKAMFFSWTITGIAQIWRVDGPKRFPRELTGGADNTSLAPVTPDGRWLVVQRDRKGEENPGLYLQPPAGGPLDVIQHLPGIQTRFEVVSPDSKYVYFTSNDRKPDSYVVYRWDVAKKTKEAVFDKEEGLWRVSDIRDDGRLLLRRETGSLTAEYFEYDPAKQALAPLLGQGEKEEYDARYGARDGTLLVVTNKLGEFRRLYVWTGGKLQPIGDEVNADVDAFDVDRKRTRVAYTTNEGGFTRPHALDARTLKPLKLPAVPEADHVTFGPTTPDGRFTTVGVDDGRHPLQGYVLDWAGGRLDAWHAPSTPEIDTASFARAQLETYPARDGAKIPVLVRRPDRCPPDAPCPVVVAFHGGPEGQARPGFSVGAQMFVDAGFVYVEPNVRGSDGYGKTWLHADDGPRRLEIVTDIEDASKWARVKFASGGREPKVGIYGGSYGGYSVLVGMTMFAGAYDAGVDVVGISDLRTFLRNTAPYRRILRISEYGDPEADAEALAKLSPMTYVDRVNAF